jgi:hypothetical protein
MEGSRGAVSIGDVEVAMSAGPKTNVGPSVWREQS